MRLARLALAAAVCAVTLVAATAAAAEEAPAPTVWITSPTDGAIYAVGMTVSVAVSYSDPTPDLTPGQCVLNWGDGTASTGYVIEAGGQGRCYAYHPYLAPGTYYMTATVADDGVVGESQPLRVEIRAVEPTTTTRKKR